MRGQKVNVMGVKRFLPLVLGLALLFPPGSNATGSATDNRFMIVAAHPLAVEAGFEILQNGGSALDAAVAVQMVLSLVEPQSSGIGGGAFLLHWDAQRKKISAYDGRETAPRLARKNRFLLPDDLNPQPFYQAVVGGRSVGVPGLLKMLEAAHRDHGRKPWSELFKPAIVLAQESFTVSPRLNSMLKKDRYLKNSPGSREYFYHGDGVPRERLVNPAFAHTLGLVATKGAKGFYEGSVARAIVDTVARANPSGDLSLADLRGYQAKRRQPLCRPYRIYRICSMPPPTSGGIAALQIMGILEQFDVADEQKDSAKMVHLFSQAQRLAFADRNHYVADPDFVSVPVEVLLDGAYLKSRAKTITLDRDIGKAAPGSLSDRDSDHGAGGRDISLPSTSHISIVNGRGNAVAMTTSIENSFGSRLMVDGFLLNNQLTDFSFVHTLDGKPVANRVEPGKRPRSSMSPIMVFDAQNKLRVVAGSPGGSRIIGYVARTLWYLLEWNLDPQSAVAAPNFGNRNTVTELEEGSGVVFLQESLEDMGHVVQIKTMNSGLNVITLGWDGLQGGTDPRREGVVMEGVAQHKQGD